MRIPLELQEYLVFLYDSADHYAHVVSQQTIWSITRGCGMESIVHIGLDEKSGRKR